MFEAIQAEEASKLSFHATHSFPGHAFGGSFATPNHQDQAGKPFHPSLTQSPLCGPEMAPP